MKTLDKRMADLERSAGSIAEGSPEQLAWWQEMSFVQGGLKERALEQLEQERADKAILLERVEKAISYIKVRPRHGWPGVLHASGSGGAADMVGPDGPLAGPETDRHTASGPARGPTYTIG